MSDDRDKRDRGERQPIEKKDIGSSELGRKNPGNGTFVSFDRPIPPEKKGGK
jgi:hypothetical protein